MPALKDISVVNPDFNHQPVEDDRKFIKKASNLVIIIVDECSCDHVVSVCVYQEMWGKYVDKF